MKNYPVHQLKLANGETIAWREAGQEGKTLILVHGNMSSSVHFQTTMERLEDTYKVYAIDMRGFGDSSYLHEVNSLRDFAEDIKLWIKALDLKKFHILGWSTGGGVVLELAVDMPNHVEKVLLLDSVGIKGYQIFPKEEKGHPYFINRLITKEDIKADPFKIAPIMMAYGTRNKEFLKRVWNGLIYNLKQPPFEDYDLYLEAILKQRNLVDVYYSLMHFNMTHDSNGVNNGTGRLDFIPCPVVILHGVLDMVVPFHQAEEMKAYLKDKATLVPLQGIGHSCLTDNLDLFIKKVKEQLEMIG